MITTKELKEWRKKILTTYEKAIEESEKAESKKFAEYYSCIASIANSQMSLIKRLIEQSLENEKEKGK